MSTSATDVRSPPASASIGVLLRRSCSPKGSNSVVFASVGLSFLMVELADRAVLERAKAKIAAITEATERPGTGAARLSLHLYTRHGVDTGPAGSVDLRARMFSPLASWKPSSLA